MNSNKTSRRLFVLLMLIAPLTVLAQKEISKTFNGIKKVKINTASGSCRIKKSESAAVTIELKYTYDDDDYTPSITQQGDELVVKEKFHNNSSSGSADWTLTVPNDLPVRFTTGSGDIYADGISLNLNATTGSGDVTFSRITGEVECTTGSGDVELDNVSGDVQVTSGSGSFDVTMSKGNLKLISGSGNHKISQCTAEFRITTGSGKINAAAISTEGSSSFTTGSGSAELQLASSPKHDLSVTSGSGNATINFNGNEIIGEIVMKASKKHGNIEAPFEFDKTEEISNNGNDVTIQKTAVRGGGGPQISISTGSGSAVLKK